MPVGSFYKVSRKYMPLYVVEFQLPYNIRKKVFNISLEFGR
jgi:hypothetical protein